MNSKWFLYTPNIIAKAKVSDIWLEHVNTSLSLHLFDNVLIKFMNYVICILLRRVTRYAISIIYLES